MNLAADSGVPPAEQEGRLCARHARVGVRLVDERDSWRVCPQTQQLFILPRAEVPIEHLCRRE